MTRGVKWVVDIAALLIGAILIGVAKMAEHAVGISSVPTTILHTTLIFSGVVWVWGETTRRLQVSGLAQGPWFASRKQCPYCAEKIKAAATKCRYCGSELAQPDVQSNATPIAPVATCSTSSSTEAESEGWTVSKQLPRNIPLLVRVWRGDVSVWKTFFVYTLLPYLALFFACNQIGKSLLSYGKLGVFEVTALVIPALVALIFSFVALLRSSKRFKGQRALPTIMMGWVGLHVLWLSAFLLSFVGFTEKIEWATGVFLGIVSLQLSMGTPTYIDQYTTLTSVSSEIVGESPTLTYHVKLSGLDTARLNQTEMSRLFFRGVAKGVCSDTAARWLLNYGVQFRYKFRDSYRELGSFTVSVFDCY